MRTIPWLNNNAYRRYPLIEDAVLTIGATTLPLAAILDFELTCFARATTAVYLYSVSVAAGVLTFNFGLSVSLTNSTLATAIPVAVPAIAATPYTTEIVTLTNGGGRVTFGTGIVDIAGWGDATYTLATPARIEPARIGFMDGHHLTSIIGTGPGSVVLNSGPIFLIEGYNCLISFDTDLNQITVNAVYGAGLGIYCGEDAVGYDKCSGVLLSINGLHADNLGEFTFVGGAGITIESGGAHTLNVKTNVDPDALRCG